MKKFYWLFLVAATIVSACSGEEGCTGDNPEAKGSISISGALDGNINPIETRATADDLEIYLYDSQDNLKASGLASSFADNQIKDLVPGTYYLEAGTHIGYDGEWNFNDPAYYKKVTDIVVEADKNTDVKVVCPQHNAGIRFTYHPSLAENGLGDIIPELSQPDIWGTKKLLFQDGHRNSTGYIEAGVDAILTFTNNGVTVPVGGQDSQTLRLNAADVMNYTLRVVSSDAGGISMEVTIDTSTNEMSGTLIIGEPGEEPDSPLPHIQYEIVSLDATSFYIRVKGNEADGLTFIRYWPTTKADYESKLAQYPTYSEADIIITFCGDRTIGNGPGMPFWSEEGLGIIVPSLDPDTEYVFAMRYTKDGTKYGGILHSYKTPAQ